MKINTLIGYLLLCFAAIGSASEAVTEIRIGSKLSAENQLLAEIMAQHIEQHTSYRVVRLFSLGGTAVAFNALSKAQVDLYPECIGTAWQVILNQTEPHHSLEMFSKVKQQFKQKYDLVWLEPFGFSNSYAIAMKSRVANHYQIETISDLAQVADQFTAGFTHEFLSRTDGFSQLAARYQLNFKKVFALEHSLAYQAIEHQKADVIEVWATDGKLSKYQLKVLTDDRHFFPPYHAAPVIRQSLLQKAPELEVLLNQLSFTMTNESAQALNYRVEQLGESIPAVAASFLQSLSESALKQESLPPTLQTQYLTDLPRYLREHIQMTLLGIVLSVSIGVPVGLFIARRPRWRMLILMTAGVIQTIPSLALLALFIPIPGLGLGYRSAVLALFLYALLPIIRATYTGMKEIEPETIEAAIGIGLRPKEILKWVKIPLITRPIMSGVRTATAICIGVTTLAAFIGGGGLGEPIITGLTLNNTQLILVGAIPAAILAIVADSLLHTLERQLTPKGLRRQESFYGVN